MKQRLLILFFFFSASSIALNAQVVTDPWKTLGSVQTQPVFIAFDAYNNMYVANYRNNTISKITPSGIVTEAWASLAANSYPYGMVIDAVGNLYTANRGPKTISKIIPSQDGTSGTVIQTWADLGVDANDQGAYTIAIDASGNLYVPYIQHNRIAKIVPSGIINTSWATLATGAYPYSISLDADGNLYTANSNNTISKITPLQDGSSGAITPVWANLASNSDPKLMTFDATGNLYVTCWGSSTVNSTVSKITPSGGVTNAWADLGLQAWPVGIVCDASGNIFTANHWNSTISKITSDGTVTKSYVSLVTQSFPYFLAFDAFGDLYVTALDKNSVSKISYLLVPLVPKVYATSSASGAICAGTNVTFAAKSSGILIPTYQWYKNGVAITGATSATYSTTSLSNNDQIKVLCAPNNIYSSTIITTLNTSLPSANITVNGDACINKTSLTTPTGLTSYAWYKDNVIINGETSNTYTPTATGDYKVQVNNGTCSNTSTVTTIYNCGVTADGRMSPTSAATTLVSNEGGINIGTGINELGSILNTTDLTNTVVSNGKIWMDRNLGASQVAMSLTDAASFGDMYQWGRGTDGHEKRTSLTTSTLSSLDLPGNATFITTSNSDWRSAKNDDLWQGVNGINNPCPAGFRLPTAAEWIAEHTAWSSLNKDEVGAFASPLKLPKAGYRGDNGSIRSSSGGGLYWSSTVSVTYPGRARVLVFDTNYLSIGDNARSYGFSVRCIKN